MSYKQQYNHQSNVFEEVNSFDVIEVKSTVEKKRALNIIFQYKLKVILLIAR
jgi:citrate lyase gamma subunit